MIRQTFNPQDAAPATPDRLAEEAKNYTNGVDEGAFHDSALAKLGRILRWQEGQNLEGWADNLLNQLVPFVGGMQGVLYRADSTRKELHYLTAFAIDFNSDIRKVYPFGDGLVGQVALNQEMMVLGDNQEFAALASVSKVRLKGILILPLVYNYKTVGVIEIVFPQPPSGRYLHFLQLISEGMAASLNALLNEQALAQSFKQLQASEERLKRLAEVTTEGIVFLNRRGQVLECNEAFAKIFGYAHERDILSTSFTEFVEDFTQNDLNNLLRTDVATELIGKRADGMPIDIEVQERDLPLLGDIAHIVSVRDITQRKQTESTLRDTEARLEEAQRIVELSELIKQKNRNITASINYAKRIQNALLPELHTIHQALPDSFVFFRPRDIVSGDFYWFAEEEGKIVLAAVDCTGHGVPGAIMSIAGAVFLKQIVNLQGITDPAEILTQLHANIQKSLKQQETRNRDGMDAAICVIDPQQRTLEFAGAKLNLFYVRQGVMEELIGDTMSIGGHLGKKESIRVFHKHVLALDDTPTMCYMASDGYEDQFGGEDGKKFMRSRLRDLMLKIYTQSPESQLSALNFTMDNWMQEERQIDDMLVVGFRV